MKPQHASPDDLTFQDVLAILEIIRQASRFDIFEVSTDGMCVHVAARRGGHDATSERHAVTERATSLVTAPAVGVVSWAGSGRSPVTEAGTVAHGQTPLGRIETLNRITEVISEREGVVVELLAEHETFVEYGQPLLRIEHR